jgi:hypothetical protein
LLFWLAPGWKADPGIDRSFDTVTELSTRVREARIAIWSWPYLDSDYSYERAPVKSHKDDVRALDNALDVLALHSGGGRLNTSTYLAEMIGKCIEEESVFYTWRLIFRSERGGCSCRLNVTKGRVWEQSSRRPVSARNPIE